MSELPQPPISFLRMNGNNGSDGDDSYQRRVLCFKLSNLGDELSEINSRREFAFQQGRKINKSVASIRALMEAAGADSDSSEKNKVEEEMKNLDNILSTTFEKMKNKTPREFHLSYKMEDVIRLKAYQHFLKTGMLLEFSACNNDSNNDVIFQDEEYLSGIITFSHDLARYGLGRAILRDKNSVLIARDVASQLMTCLLSFDFRNGPLRKRYDGVKYALNRLEMLLYEFAITVPAEAPSTATLSKKRVNTDDLEQIRQRMEHKDDIREILIKRCRDLQRLAKQSIYAMHRSDMEHSKFLLNKFESILNEEQVQSVLSDNPSLRYVCGAFTSALEEYVEAKLFLHWKEHHELMKIQDIAQSAIPLQIDEYLGGLCDLTGEINRFAVAKGTERDLPSVQFCLATNLQILTELQCIEQLPIKIVKKMDAVRHSVEKLERMLYELNLIQGGRVMVEGVEDRLRGVTAGDGDVNEDLT